MINFNNAYAKGSGSNSGASRLLEGASNGTTIVKSLEIITGNESSEVHIVRTDGTDNFGALTTNGDIAGSASVYADIVIQAKSNDYLILWEGFFVIPSGHRLYFKSDSLLCKCVVNYVDIQGTSSPSP